MPCLMCRRIFSAKHPCAHCALLWCDDCLVPHQRCCKAVVR